MISKVAFHSVMDIVSQSRKSGPKKSHLCDRECWEEIGIAKSSVEVWCSFPPLSSRNQGDYGATPVLGFVPDFDPSNLKLSSSEVEQVFCVKFSELTDPSCFGHTQFRVEVSALFCQLL